MAGAHIRMNALLDDPVRITVICAVLSVAVVLGFQLAAVAYDRWQARKLARYDAELAAREASREPLDAPTVAARRIASEWSRFNADCVQSLEQVRRAEQLRRFIAENEVKP